MTVKSYRWFSLISGIILLCFSFSMLQNPLTGLVALSLFLGIVFLIHGIGELVLYFSLPHDIKTSWLLIGGLISVVFGGWTLTGKGTAAMTVALPFVVATWILFFGILRIVASMNLREISKQLSNVNLILGILGIVLGIIMLYHPLVGGTVISAVVFAIFFCQGIGSIANFLWYRDWR